MTREEPVKLELEILAEYTSNDDLDKMATNLYQDIHGSNVESVERLKSGDAPAGSKAGEVVSLGALAVEVLPTVLPSLFGLVQDWIYRGRGRTVKFKCKEIEFEGSLEDLHILLAALEKGKKKK